VLYGVRIKASRQKAATINPFHRQGRSKATTGLVGKCTIKWTRLTCSTFAANAVQLQLHALGYNLGKLPARWRRWSRSRTGPLTSLKEKLIKIGAKVVSPAARHPTAKFPGDFAAYRKTGRSHHQRQRETFDSCVRATDGRSASWPDQTLERHSGRLECREAAPFQAIQKIATIQASSGVIWSIPLQRLLAVEKAGLSIRRSVVETRDQRHPGRSYIRERQLDRLR
jgi:hypothetical protein